MSLSASVSDLDASDVRFARVADRPLWVAMPAAGVVARRNTATHEAPASVGAYGPHYRQTRSCGPRQPACAAVAARSNAA